MDLDDKYPTNAELTMKNTPAYCNTELIKAVKVFVARLGKFYKTFYSSN